MPRKDDTTATFSLRLERSKWAEIFFRLMDGILNMGLAVVLCMCCCCCVLCCAMAHTFILVLCSARAAASHAHMHPLHTTARHPKVSESQNVARSSFGSFDRL
eukprot:COSAG01_NODE_44183_length_421_cov_5.677019_1_plen_102_part_10